MYGRARDALYHIARVLKQEVIWAPAYHCPAMIQPFLAAGKLVRLYPVSESLVPACDYLRGEVASGDAVLAVRFFGFDCGIDGLSQVCSESGSVLIEDLAHAPFVRQLLGDFAVTSLWKFYPVEAGAELCLPLSSSFYGPVKAMHDSLPGRVAQFGKKLARKLKRHFNSREDLPASIYFDTKSVSKQLSRKDVGVFRSVSPEEIGVKRRKNYSILSKSLAASVGGSPLFPELPEGVVPYALPFLMSDESYFRRMRELGIQVLRWEEVAKSDCGVSKDYRRRLIQVPCHDELDTEQLETITDALCPSTP